MFGASYLLATIIFVAAWIASQRRIALDLKATSPVMLTPLSVLASLLIGFLAARVWANLDHANSYAASEATAIHEVVMLADALPAGPRAALRDAMRNYRQYVETEDWPAMMAGRASLRRVPPNLADAMKGLLSFVPTEPGQQVAQQRAPVAIEEALEARRNRILLSKATIAPIQWWVIIARDALVLLTIAMVHVDRRATTAINLFVFSTAIAACLVLLLVDGRPFSAGGATVQPDALREIGFD
jgi:hypothetical protein